MSIWPIASLVETWPIQLGVIVLAWVGLNAWEMATRRTIPSRLITVAATVTVGWLVLYAVLGVVELLVLISTL